MRAVRDSVVLSASLLLGACAGDPSALDPRGPAAERVAGLWWLMLALAAAVFCVFAAFLLPAIFGSRRPTSGGERSDNRLIIGAGIVMPLVVLIPLSVVTMRTGAAVAFRSDPSHVKIEVIGHQFWWEVRYPDDGVVTANEIHIPVGRKVDLTLRASDVIHSFWVPRLAGKIDNIPGQTTNLHLEAREAGIYRGFCAEFCGIQHANMQLLVIAEEEAEFAAWVAGQARGAARPAGALAQEGERVFNATGCGACHAVRGTAAVGTLGPDLTHFGGRLTIGSATVDNNRGNLGGWIANPQSIKPGNKMPATPLTGDQLQAVIAYLEGLG